LIRKLGLKIVKAKPQVLPAALRKKEVIRQ
jgi:hypothetical protein